MCNTHLMLIGQTKHVSCHPWMSWKGYPLSWRMPAPLWCDSLIMRIHCAAKLWHELPGENRHFFGLRLLSIEFSSFSVRLSRLPLNLQGHCFDKCPKYDVWHILMTSLNKPSFYLQKISVWIHGINAAAKLILCMGLW